MDSPSNPESLRGRSTVDFREDRSTDDEDTFECFRSIAGLVAVGIPNEEGALPLMHGPQGWRLPYGSVGVDEDWVTAGRQIGREIMGISVDLELDWFQSVPEDAYWEHGDAVDDIGACFEAH